ncbi:Aste57867_17154 [Aphanomyces stellatus]|uniref:Aste57867_17154 protein n=1 Tax=Aphanomyces stellatus TaxID=120398 RepID=A0A485L812_9STRA|nr:hypothetical protein As57867_017095 [Aphanomyces stellatus]VFT93911.1 Aste57867_17154 [Aphanomyces stellatus]
MPRGKNITDEEKGQILAYLRMKKSFRWIARELNRSDKLVRSFVANRRNPTPKAKLGRRVKLTRREIRYTFRLATRNGQSSSQISRALGGKVTRSTVLNILNSSKFVKYMKRRSSPHLTKDHKKRRVEFAAKYLNKDVDLKGTIFSDDKKFNLDGPDGCQYYWYDLHEEVQTYSKRAAGGGSVMVCGAMSFYNKSELAFLEGRQNSLKYQATLRSHMMPI